MFLLSIGMIYNRRDVTNLVIAFPIAFLTLLYFIAPKVDPRVYAIKFFPLAIVVSSVLVKEKIVIPRRLPLFILLVTVILFSHAYLLQSNPIQSLIEAEILPAQIGTKQIQNIILFTYPTWDPSNAIKQLVEFNDISGKTILTNCPPALVYFLRKTSKTQRIFWQPNQIEMIGVALDQIGVENLQKELGEKRFDLLLYFAYPEIACFGEEGLRYLTQKYQFTTFESGEYDTLLFYLNKQSNQ